MFKSCSQAFHNMCLSNRILIYVNFYFFTVVVNCFVFKLFINLQSTLFFSYFNQLMSRLYTLSTGINNNNKLNIFYYL